MKLPTPVAVRQLCVHDVTVDQIVAACCLLEKEDTQWRLARLPYQRDGSTMVLPVMLRVDDRLAVTFISDGRPILAIPGEQHHDVALCDIEYPLYTTVKETPYVDLAAHHARLCVLVAKLADRLDDLLRT